MLHNYHTDGRSWKKHGVLASQVRARMAPVKDGSKVLAGVVEEILAKAIEEGMLPDPAADGATA
jgi:putative hydrolase of HD superfamily